MFCKSTAFLVEMQKSEDFLGTSDNFNYIIIWVERVKPVGEKIQHDYFIKNLLMFQDLWQIALTYKRGLKQANRTGCGRGHILPTTHCGPHTSAVLYVVTLIRTEGVAGSRNTQ